jgi:hypothetical protein
MPATSEEVYKAHKLITTYTSEASRYIKSLENINNINGSSITLNSDGSGYELQISWGSQWSDDAVVLVQISTECIKLMALHYDFFHSIQANSLAANDLGVTVGVLEVFVGKGMYLIFPSQETLNQAIDKMSKANPSPSEPYFLPSRLENAIKLNSSFLTLLNGRQKILAWEAEAKQPEITDKKRQEDGEDEHSYGPS